jgi:hypothetical protein
MTGTESKSSGILGRIHTLRQQHPRAEHALFFAAGFLFDTLAVGRIDEAWTLLQMAAYLAVLATLMLMEERHRAGLFSPPWLLARAWRFAEDAIHFLFGTLLNVFTLFYLKSTSGLLSLLFLVFLGALLVVNELPRFRKRGPMVRFALLSMCLTTYLALLLPVLLGFLSRWLFVAAVVLSCAALAGLLRSLPRGTDDTWSMGERMAGPAFGMQALLVIAYFAGIIPPVPLSVQYMGIYHEVAIESQSEAAGTAAPGTAAGARPGAGLRQRLAQPGRRIGPLKPAKRQVKQAPVLLVEAGGAQSVANETGQFRVNAWFAHEGELDQRGNAVAGMGGQLLKRLLRLINIAIGEQTPAVVIARLLVLWAARCRGQCLLEIAECHMAIGHVEIVVRQRLVWREIVGSQPMGLLQQWECELEQREGEIEFGEEDQILHAFRAELDGRLREGNSVFYF